MLRSWGWIKRLQGEALHFTGPEREVVRSVALVTLGGFNIVLSLLPPSRAVMLQHSHPSARAAVSRRLAQFLALGAF